MSLKIPTAYSVVRSSSRSSPVYNIVLNTAYCCHHTVHFAASDRTSEWGGTGESKLWVCSERTESERCCRASEGLHTTAATSATRNWYVLVRTLNSTTLFITVNTLSLVAIRWAKFKESVSPVGMSQYNSLFVRVFYRSFDVPSHKTLML